MPKGMTLCIAGDVGIEPTLAVLETAVLPLNESPEISAYSTMK